MLVAVVISITIITASQLFTDKISRLLDRQASELLAADAVVLSSAPINTLFFKTAEQYQLKTAKTISLRTAVFVKDNLQLIELKAVDSRYPLRGYLETQTELASKPVQALTGPNIGELWVDQQIASFISEQIIEIGEVPLTPTKILTLEPDRGGSLFNVAPRIMIHLDDIDATNLLGIGSRARYRLLVSGESEQVSAFIEFVKPLLSADESIQDLKNARPEMRTALDRVRNFFALGIMMTLVIAMSAIALSARYIASLEAQKVAVMRVFGIPQTSLLRYYFLQLLKLWVLAVPLGWLAGWLSQIPIEWLLGQWFSHSLPSNGVMPYIMGALFGAIGLFGFSLPYLMSLLKTSPNSVLRSQQWQVDGRQTKLLLMVTVSLALLVLLLVPDWKLALISLALIILLILLVPVIIKLVMLLMKKTMVKTFWLRGFVLSRLLHSPRNSLFIMTAFMLTLLAVLLVGVVKDDVFNDWKRMLKTDTPNFFAINIQPDEASVLSAVLKQNNLDSSNIYPVVNARFMTSNETEVESLDYSSGRAQKFITRVYKLSASTVLPAENEVLEGLWPPEKGTISVEQSMAEVLNLKLGDQLGFDIAGQMVDFKISSIRSVVWENFKPNFYVLAKPEDIKKLPQTYIMSVFLPQQQKNLLADLHNQFPAVTWLDVSQLMGRIKNLIDRSALALEFFFLFAVLAGVIVLLSSILASQQQRVNEIALLKSLGVSQKQIIKVQLAEFVTMGLLVGILASFFASLFGYLVSVFLFDITYSFSLWLWVLGIGSSVLLLSITGLIAVKNTFSSSPVQLLRSI